MSSMPPHAYGCDCNSCTPDEYEACEGDYDYEDGDPCPDTARAATCTPPSLETLVKDLVSEIGFLRQRIEDLEGKPVPRAREAAKPQTRSCYTCGKPALFGTDTTVPRCALCSR